jgi:hypothetical protein
MVSFAFENDDAETCAHIKFLVYVKNTYKIVGCRISE